MNGPTYYSILGVPDTASLDDIKAAYRTVMKSVHPDHDSPLSYLAKEVNVAYETLTNPEKRAQYDAQLVGDNQGTSGSGFSETDFGWGDMSSYNNPEPDPPSQSTGAGDPWSQTDDLDDAPLPSLADYTVRIDWAQIRPAGPLQPETIVPTVPSAKRAWIVFAVSWLAVILAVGFLNSQPGMGSFPMMMLFGSALPLTYGLVVKPSMAGLMKVLFVVALIGAALTLLPALLMVAMSIQYLPSLAFALVFALLFVIATVPQFIAARWLRASRTAALNMPEATSVALAAQRIVGRPGDLGDALAKFGTLNTAKGIVGEKLTYGLLVRLAQTPGFRVFNGLRFPGAPNADVDHAIVCGRRMVLIDSKLWGGATYAWQPDGSIRRTTGSMSRRVESHFPAAVAAYQQVFTGFTVVGWILVHPNGHEDQLAFDNTYATNTSLADAQTVIASVYRFLTDGHTGQVDRRDLARIYPWVKR